MQIDEDDSDHNLEAITKKERKPSRIPLCPATPQIHTLSGDRTAYW